jgi:hypothetical protein
MKAVQALLLGTVRCVYPAGTVRCVYPPKIAGVFRSQIFCSDIEIIHGFTQSLQGQCGENGVSQNGVAQNGVAQNALQITGFIHNTPFPCPLTFLEMRLQKLRNDSPIFRLVVFISAVG